MKTFTKIFMSTKQLKQILFHFLKIYNKIYQYSIFKTKIWTEAQQSLRKQDKQDDLISKYM